MATLELELTYLASSLPEELSRTTPTRLVDIYIPASPAVHAKLRIRQKGDSYTITKKVPVVEGDASRQNEYDIPLSQEEFDELSTVSTRKVVKDRYVLPLGGHTAEIDVFQEELAGLVLIDFEFDTEEEKNAFIPPSVCLADVTQEEFIAGGKLAGRSYKDLETDLLRFSYTPLAV